MKLTTAMTVLGISGMVLLGGAGIAAATGDDLELSGCDSLAGGKTVPGWLRYMTVTLDDGQTQTWTNPDAPNYDDDSFDISFSFPTVAAGDHTYVVTDSNGELVSTFDHEVYVPPCPVPSTEAPVTTPAPAPTTATAAPTTVTTIGGAAVIETTTTAAPPVETSALALGPTVATTAAPGVEPSVLSAGATLPATGTNDPTRNLAPIGVGFLTIGGLALWAVRREGRGLSPAARKALGSC
jgi:hypothetical protein